MRRFLVEETWVRGLCEALAFVGWAASASFGWHQAIGILIGGVIVYLAFNLLRVYIDHLKADARLNQKDRAIRGLLRVLTTSMSAERPGIRATLLLPDSQNKHLTPVHRYQLGGPSGKCTSTAKFPKGVAFAGLAWQSVKVPFKKGDIPDFQGSEEAFVHYYMTEFKMSTELVQKLSSHMRQVRSIFCIGLVDHEDDFIAVLSLDSTYPDAFERMPELHLHSSIEELEATLERP